MTSTQTTKRPTRDPLKVLVDLDSLRLGHQLALHGALEWPVGYVPRRPLGRVRFEGARQVATFVVPLVLMVLAYLQGGFQVALQMVPFALVAGLLLDKQVTSAIARKKDQEAALDRGNYATARELAFRLGLQLEDINAARVARLHEDYILEERRLMPYAIEGYAKGLAEGEVLKQQRLDRMLAEGEARAAKRGQQAQAKRGQGGRSNAQGSPVPQDFMQPVAPMVNIDGNMMIPGTNIDVTGKPYGSMD